MFFEVFSFSGLQVEPRVGEGSDVGQKCFDERMKFILGETERRIHHCRAVGCACASGVCGLEVCVSAGEKGERGREEERERRGEKKKSSLLLAFTFPTRLNCSQPALLPLHELNFNPA